MRTKKNRNLLAAAMVGFALSAFAGLGLAKGGRDYRIGVTGVT